MRLNQPYTIVDFLLGLIALPFWLVLIPVYLSTKLVILVFLKPYRFICSLGKDFRELFSDD